MHAINGYEMTSPDKALEICTKLQQASEVTFEISRRGHPVELTITITK